MTQTRINTLRRRLAGQRVLTVTLALTILLAIFVTVSVALSERRAAVQDAEGKARHAARLMAAEIGGVLSVADVILTQAVDLAGPGSAPIAASRDTWEALVRLMRTSPLLEALWFGGPDGAAILSTHQYPAPALSAADRDYFIVQRDRDPGLYLSVVQRDRYTATRLPILSRRLERPDGSFRGFVTATLSPEPLRAILGRVGTGVLASIVTADGTVVVGVPVERMETDAAPDRRFATATATAAAASGAYRDRADADDPRLVLFQRVEPHELFVRLDAPLRPILDDWASTHLLGYILAGTAAVLSILGWGWLVLSRSHQAETTVGELGRVRLGMEERLDAHTDSLRQANQRLAEAVADKEVLYREAHHRVKNNLQVVTSLLQLQAARLAPEMRRPFEDSVARISAMSLVHDLLYRSEQPARIDFSHYLRAVAEALLARRGESERITLELDCEPVLMDLDRAVPLALLVNELLGVTLDHGLADDRTGRLTLRFRREDEGARLVVGHDGIVDRQLPSGFALLLIDSLCGQIGASVTSERSGAGFTVFVPLPAAQREHSRAAS